MIDLLKAAISDFTNCPLVYLKFLTSNDVGLTKSHQKGIAIGHSGHSILFSDGPGIKGENKKAEGKIDWVGYKETLCHFIYYGQKTRNEYRITNFGRSFKYLTPEYVGALLVLCRPNRDLMRAYVLDSKEDIAEFLDNFNLTKFDTNTLLYGDSSIDIKNAYYEDAIKPLVDSCGRQMLSGAAVANYSTTSVLKRLGNDFDPDAALVECLRLDEAITDELRIAITGNEASDELKERYAKLIHSLKKSRLTESLYSHAKDIISRFDISCVYKGNGRFIIGENRGAELCIQPFIRTKDDFPAFDGGRPSFVLTIQKGILPDLMIEQMDKGVQIAVPASMFPSYPKSIQGQLLNFASLIAKLQSLQHRK